MLGARKTWAAFAPRAPYAATVPTDIAQGAKDIGRFREAEGARGMGGAWHSRKTAPSIPSRSRPAWRRPRPARPAARSR
jgi:hypothetical protein